MTWVTRCGIRVNRTATVPVRRAGRRHRLAPWDRATVHLNVATTLTRAQRFDLFGSAILEGRRSWRVRPVSEFVVAKEFGAEDVIVGLVGIIWRPRERLSCDLGFRRAGIDGRDVSEVRAGFTSELSLGGA